MRNINLQTMGYFVVKGVLVPGLLLTILACSSARIEDESPILTSNPQYLKDNAPSGELDFKSMITNLSRDRIRQGVGVEAYPMSGALIEVMTRDLAYKEGLSEKEAQKKLVELKNMIKGKICFSVHLHSKTYDATVLKYWGLELINQHLNKFPLSFLDKETLPDSKTSTNVSSSSSGGYYIGDFYVPVRTSVTSNEVTTHSNSGIACTKTRDGINLSESFALSMLPRFEKNLPRIDLVWKQKDAPEAMKN